MACKRRYSYRSPRWSGNSARSLPALDGSDGLIRDWLGGRGRYAREELFAA